MLNKNEIRILEKMIGNLSLEFTISDIARQLKQKYPQTYKSCKSLVEKDLVKIKNVGKSKVLRLDFSKYHLDYAIAEIERLSKIINNKGISGIFDKVLKINKQFICILFGSYASGHPKKDSDIDILFIIPNGYDTTKFEKLAKNNLSVYNVDLNVITEDSLFEMWSSPSKLNVGNELFKNHVVLFGAEYFISLVRKHYVGR